MGAKDTWVCFVKFQNEFFELIEILGSGFFNLREHAGDHFSCRGSVANYEIRENRLFLDSLMIYAAPVKAASSDSNDQVMPVINGVVGVEDRFKDFLYSTINFPVPFCGSMLLASGYTRDLMTSSGQHPVLCHEKVLKLCFVSGEMTGVENASRESVQLRASCYNGK